MEEKSCLKCGRPCPPEQAFCGECLAEMEKYPVKPGVVVLLPQREPSIPKPAGRRKAAPSPEEQILRLKKRITALRLALLLSLAAIGSLVWLTVSDYLHNHKAVAPLPGQNYSSEVDTGPETTD